MTRGKRVVVTDHAFGDVEAEREVARRHGASFAEFACVGEHDAAEAVSGADVVLNNFAPITDQVLAALAPGATVVRYGVGVDNVDVAAASRRGVRVCNVPDYGVDTVADHAAASMLSLLRRLPQYDHAIKTQGWCVPGDVGPLAGFGQTTIGLLGAGRIALALHQRLRVFGFSFVAHDPGVPSHVLADRGVRAVDLEELAASSDALSLHAPLVEATRGVVDAEFLARMPRRSVLVNTSRGGLVDTDALTASLASGHTSGASLDVTDPEPLPADSPLRAMSQVLLSPHAAFYSTESLANLQRLAAEEVERALTGQPLRAQVSPPPDSSSREDAS